MLKVTISLNFCRFFPVIKEKILTLRLKELGTLSAALYIYLFSQEKTIRHVSVCPDPYFSNVGPFVGFLPGDLLPLSPFLPSSPQCISPAPIHTGLVLLVHLPPPSG